MLNLLPALLNQGEGRRCKAEEETSASALNNCFVIDCTCLTYGDQYRRLSLTFADGSHQRHGRSADKHRLVDRCSSQFDSEADYLINLPGRPGKREQAYNS